MASSLALCVTVFYKTGKQLLGVKQGENPKKGGKKVTNFY
jgi:hypothetical protein